MSKGIKLTSNSDEFLNVRFMYENWLEEYEDSINFDSPNLQEVLQDFWGIAKRIKSDLCELQEFYDCTAIQNKLDEIIQDVTQALSYEHSGLR